jgi:serine/threonine protein kinase
MRLPESSVSEEQKTIESLTRSLAGGRYRLMRLLGAGAMGSVRLAEDTALHRRVAIKTVKEEFARNAEIRKRVERECLLHAKVGPHPNIVTLFDKLELEDEIHLVMEYIDGETLQARLERNSEQGIVMPPSESIVIATQVLDALSRIHAQGIVHRDIKPSNIMLTYSENGQVCAKLMDFGVSRLAEQDEQLSRLTTTDSGGPGTPLYMAPEQIDSKTFGEISSATDVYAMGVMLYQLLSGKPPYRGTLTEVLNGHLNLPLPPIFIRLDGVLPDTVENLLKRALAKKSADRIQTAKTFREELIKLTGVGDTMSRLNATVQMGSATSIEPPSTVKPGLRSLATQTFLGGNTMQRVARYRRSMRVLGVGVAVVLSTLLTSAWFMFRAPEKTNATQIAASEPRKVVGAGFIEQPVPSPEQPATSTVVAPQTTPAASVTPGIPAPTTNTATEQSTISASLSPTFPGTTLEKALADAVAKTNMDQMAAAAAAYQIYQQQLAINMPPGITPAIGGEAPVVESAVVQTGGEATSADGSREHVVVPGDTLSKIAANYGVELSDLQWWNNILNPSTLRVGQTLLLYAKDGLAPKSDFMAQYAAAKARRASSAPNEEPEMDPAPAPRTLRGKPTLEHTFRAPVESSAPPKEVEKPRRRGLFRGLRGND